MGDMVGDFGGVVLPHPRLQQRAFVLLPLAEIAPQWRHPESGETVQALLQKVGGLGDTRRVAGLDGIA